MLLLKIIYILIIVIT